jgi:ribosomal protein S18 acetylase RimI-like enzyme
MDINQAENKDKEEIFALLVRCKNRLIEQKIYQWDSEYPSIDYIDCDISKGSLNKLSINGKIAGVISFDDFQESQYFSVSWKLPMEPVVVIHRLAVDPEFQGCGFAKQLMNFAEISAAEAGYATIRLDAYSGNQAVVGFYARRGYTKAGEIFFPRRDLPFVCMERSAKI